MQPVRLMQQTLENMGQILNTGEKSDIYVMLNYQSIKNKTKHFCKSIMNKLNKERTLNNIFNSFVPIRLHNILISADININPENEF